MATAFILTTLSKVEKKKMSLAENLQKFITRGSAVARSRTSVEHLELFVRVDTCQQADTVDRT